MRVNNVRHAKNLFHKIINKNGQESLRHALFISQGALGDEKNRNFIALANEIQDKLGNSQAAPKMEAITKPGYSRKVD